MLASRSKTRAKVLSSPRIALPQSRMTTRTTPLRCSALRLRDRIPNPWLWAELRPVGKSQASLTATPRPTSNPSVAPALRALTTAWVLTVLHPTTQVQGTAPALIQVGGIAPGPILPEVLLPEVLREATRTPQPVQQVLVLVLVLTQAVHRVRPARAAVAVPTTRTLPRTARCLPVRSTQTNCERLIVA